MFSSKAAGNRIHNMAGGIDLRQLENTFRIKTGEKKSMDLDGIIVVFLILETLRMLEFILIILCYCYCDISPMVPVLKYLKILICDLKERAVIPMSLYDVENNSSTICCNNKDQK